MFCSSDDNKNALLLLALKSFSEDSEVILCEFVASSGRKMRTLMHSPVSLKKLNCRVHCLEGTLSYSDDTTNTMTGLGLAHTDRRTRERSTLIGPLMTKIDN